MLLSKSEKRYEKWLARERALSSLSKASLGLLSIPSFSFYEMLVSGRRADVFAGLALIGVLAFRSFLAGILAKTQFRLELAKKTLQEEQAP